MNKFTFILSFAILSFSMGCVDQEFDEPPIGSYEESNANTTIAELIALHTINGTESIPDGIVVEGTVISDDNESNFYKIIVIQDETGGVQMKVDGYGLSTIYPTGSKITINCDGLWLGDYRGVTQLGGEVVEVDQGVSRIETALLPTFVKVVGFDDNLNGSIKEINGISLADINTLVTFEGVEFSAQDLNSTYSDAETKYAQNKTIVDCDGNEILLRTSGYANFAADVIASGNGTITGVLSVFNNDFQLFIRDLRDVNMNDARCDAFGGGVTLTPNSDIAVLKSLLGNAESVEVNDELIIQATVISSDNMGNFYKELIVQDETGGVVIKIDAQAISTTFPVGTKLNINCQNLWLAVKNGVTQMGGAISDANNGVDRLSFGSLSDFIEIVNGGSPISGKEISLNDISDAQLATLIKLSNVEFSSNDLNSTYANEVDHYAENKVILDCEGNQVLLRTSGYADFASTQIASGNGTITGVLSAYNGAYQLFVRDLNDIDLNGTRCSGGSGGGVDSNSEDFQSINNDNKYDLINLNGWSNIVVKGEASEAWYGNFYNGNGFAEATAFNKAGEVETWLVTPSIDLSTFTSFKFKTAKHHWVHEALSVYISNDFDGTNVSAANWELVSCIIAGETDADYDWIDSGTINLGDYFNSGNANVAFKYDGDVNGSTSTYRIDDYILTE